MATIPRVMPVDWRTRYGDMIVKAANEAFDAYCRNVNQPLFLTFRPAKDGKWGELIASFHKAADTEWASGDRIPRNLTREGLADWIKKFADHLPLIGE